MKQKITLKHIARELEVSISTVSKALKNSDEISDDTKEKVQAFAKLYNYKPNNIAVSLKNKRTKNIGVVIPDIVHHFFTTVFRGIEKYANEQGYNVIICVSDESFDTVVSMEAIEHFNKQDGEKYLSEIVRVLKKGGVFVGSTPQVETKNPLKILALKKIDPYHLQLYSIKMLRLVLLNYFSNVEIESQPEEWMLFKCIK